MILRIRYPTQPLVTLWDSAAGFHGVHFKRRETDFQVIRRSLATCLTYLDVKK